jgi:hypothetical protein
VSSKRFRVFRRKGILAEADHFYYMHLVIYNIALCWTWHISRCVKVLPPSLPLALEILSTKRRLSSACSREVLCVVSHESLIVSKMRRELRTTVKSFG